MRNNYAVIKQGNKYGITEKTAGRITINKIKDFEKIVRPGNEDWFFCYQNSDSAYLYNSKYGLSTHEKFAKPKLIFSSSDTIIILSEKIISKWKIK